MFMETMDEIGLKSNYKPHVKPPNYALSQLSGHYNLLPQTSILWVLSFYFDLPMDSEQQKRKNTLIRIIGA